MLLGVVSDTHGHTGNALAAVHMLEALGVERVIHCGDVGSASIPRLFSQWPTHFVAGNVDDEDELRAAVEAAGHAWHGEFGSLELVGMKIAFLHSHDANRFQTAISSGEWDLVCYGHTHRAEQHVEGRTLVLNPGALFRARQHTIAVVELPTRTATIVPV